MGFAIHVYQGQGFKSISGLTFLQALISQLLELCALTVTGQSYLHDHMTLVSGYLVLIDVN